MSTLGILTMIVVWIWFLRDLVPGTEAFERNFGKEKLTDYGKKLKRKLIDECNTKVLNEVVENGVEISKIMDDSASKDELNLFNEINCRIRKEYVFNHPRLFKGIDDFDINNL